MFSVSAPACAQQCGTGLAGRPGRGESLQELLRASDFRGEHQAAGQAGGEGPTRLSCETGFA